MCCETCTLVQMKKETIENPVIPFGIPNINHIPRSY